MHHPSTHEDTCIFMGCPSKGDALSLATLPPGKGDSTPDTEVVVRVTVHLTRKGDSAPDISR